MDSAPPSYSARPSSSSAAIDVPIFDRDLEDSLPPPYRAASASVSVPAHNPAINLNHAIPTTYAIGKHKNVEALVHPLDLEDHLTLLRAFYRIKENVRSQSASEGALGGDDAWAVFLARSVHRFELWVKTIGRRTPAGASEGEPASWEEREIPPLDVIMVWHTYLLNPRIYYEDGLRFNRRFLLYRDLFPLHYIASIAFEPPSPCRIHHFEAYTSQPFEQPAITESSSITLRCPGCNEATEVKWYEKDGTGYSQERFFKACELCKVGLSRENFGIAKLAKDLEGLNEDLNTGSVAGLYIGPRTGTPDIKFSKEWNRNLVQGLRLSKAGDYTSTLGWRFDNAAKILKHGFAHPNEEIPDYKTGMKRILKSYNTWTCFSVDLRAAVNRQFKFVNKIASLGWLDNGAFPADSKGNDGREENRALRRCVAQYHAFLDLMAANPRKFLVPTLGIDLAWHTHQLFHTEYRKWTTALIGTLVDHDDAVEQENVAMSYRQTAQLWHSKFNTPYSVCGCQQPTVSSRASVSVFASKVLLKSPFSSAKGSKQSPGIANPRPDLLQLSENTLDETHPSEHPSVTVLNIQEVRKLRTQRLNSSDGKGKGKANATTNPNAADAWVDENEMLRQKREQHRTDCPAFHFGLLGNTNGEPAGIIMNGATLGAADCVTGMGGLGACRAGNVKVRSMIEWVPTFTGGCGSGVCGGG